jgi:hypothetical protein
MSTVLYRLSSNEVYKISPIDQSFDDRDAVYWGVVTDPSFPDGTAFKDPNGDLRVLGYSKILVGAIVRNATQEEIDTFQGFEDSDENKMDRDRAEFLFDTHPQFRKMMVAFADVLKDEFNILRQWEMDFKAVVAAASNLNDLKISVAAMDDLPDRTLTQLKTAIKDRLSEDD